MITEAILSAIVRLYRLLVRLYPRPFREQFGEEMTAVFCQHLAAAGEWRDLMAVLGRELRDWPVNCLREHVWARHHLALSSTPSITSWGVVAAVFPFLVLLSVSSAGLRLSPTLLAILLLAGLLIAWWQRWPGWVVSWLGFLIVFGQNLLSFYFLGESLAWNSVSRLLFMLLQIVMQAGWLAVMYGVVRRWPHHGTLVFLPALLLPWAFSMEFASGAMSAVVQGAAFLSLALIAAAMAVQRSASGDVWLLYGGALLPGAIISLGAVFFSPGMENAWRSFGPNVLQALAPFVAILLLHALNAWSRENGRSAQRYTRLMTAGALLSFIALLSLARLVGPSDLELFQVNVGPVLAAAWLLGSLLILVAGWRLRAQFPAPGQRHLALATLLLALLPLLYRPSFLTNTVNSLTYRRPHLSTLRDFLPTLQTADTVLAIAGFAGLLLAPLTIGWLRQQTVAFAASPTPASLRAWWQRRRERRQTGGRTGRQRLALLLTLTLLLAGGVFFTAAFLPLQLEAEPYTQQIVLGDLNGNGHLDAVLANTRRLLPNADNNILYNDGHGRFSDSGQPIGQGGTSVTLLDMDGDGRLEVVIGGMMGVTVYRQNNGRFSPRSLAVSHTPESGASQWYLQAGDLNGDGFGDVFLAGCCGIGLSTGPGEMEWIVPANRVLLGSSAGLVDSGQKLGARGSQAIALGDLNGNGYLDAFVGNTQSNSRSLRNDEPNEVWFNDGDGHFSDSGQLLGTQRTYAVTLGDVNGNGYLDALVGNEGADELWLNDGNGRFTLSDQLWSGRTTLSVFLVDLDGDGALDAVTTHQISGSFAWWRQVLIWWNDGSGRFARDDQGIRFRPNGALAVGDVNGDGRPDLVIGALDEVTVWLNEGNGRFSLIGR